MAQDNSSFDHLLATARDLAITVVTGQIGPPIDGRMWIGGRALETILCPDRVERRVAMLIASGGPGWTFIRSGDRELDATGLDRLLQNSFAAGGSLTQGWLAVLTPSMWLARRKSSRPSAVTQTTFAAAVAAGWPASFGNSPVLFLDDQPIYTLLAQANVGRTVTLLVGSVAEGREPQGQWLGAVPQDALMQTPSAVAQTTQTVARPVA